MCTLSFVNTADGYIIAMNRDERLTRGETALPPRAFGSAAYPLEPSGGTWVGTRTDGTTLALLNWTLRPGQGSGSRSRGLIIPELLQSPAASPETIPSHHLAQTAPFRLVRFVPATRRIQEWRWDGSGGMQRLDYSWQLRHWFSSGAGDLQAETQRSAVTAAAAALSDAGSLAWLRRLHRSHEPEQGAFSICAHRGIAGTLSYTEIRVASDIRLLYQPGPPCTPAADPVELVLPRQVPART